LATRGSNRLGPDDVLDAIERGVNFLNWYGGKADPITRSVSQLGKRREEVMVCMQFSSRTASEAKKELDAQLRVLGTDYVDVITFYYVERPKQWQQIIGPGGAMEFCELARRDGKIRFLGVTSHQRPLAAKMARSGLLDMLMIRYNAAHRGAETEIFPVTDELKMPVVVYTCLRWGALLESTPDDPPGFTPPPAPTWYRFALQSPSVTVALMAPATRSELDENLTVLQARKRLSAAEYRLLLEHGQRVHSHGGRFP
jgi:predicted aldo/keto reductase-like oxidoreductase